jgi:signal transduction histidine kinase
MIPRGLTSRILLGFTALAAALLIAVGGSLFYVLHELHLNEIKSQLGNQAVLIEASLLRQPTTSATDAIEQLVTDYGSTLAADGGFVLVLTTKNTVRVLVGTPSSTDLPPGPTNGASAAIGTMRTSDGKSFVYIEPSPAGTRNLTFVFAVPDRSVQRAMADMLRAILVIVLVLLIVGIPIAWLLARSITRPMRRLANAAADLPARTATDPLPVEGPSEVRTLTERFNAMAAELQATRHEEGQMLANLRHDLRTPLTSIAGYAEAIADGTATGDRATAAARTIAGEAERLEQLVGELGVVERLREGPAALRPEPLAAEDLVRAAAARFEGRAAAQQVRIEVDGAGDGGSAPSGAALAFTGDRLAVERILANLVVNSLSALRDGGHIWLRAARLEMPGRPKGVALSVTDDGPGFPPGTTERVFERFFRADPSRTGSGSGLGLAIVRELARAHGGEAWAENVAPHGARVTVLLPVVPVVAPGAGAAVAGGTAPTP